MDGGGEYLLTLDSWRHSPLSPPRAMRVFPQSLLWEGCLQCSGCPGSRGCWPSTGELCHCPHIVLRAVVPCSCWSPWQKPPPPFPPPSPPPSPPSHSPPFRAPPSPHLHPRHC